MSSVSFKKLFYMIQGDIYKFLNMCPFRYTAFGVSGKVGYL